MLFSGTRGLQESMADQGLTYRSFLEQDAGHWEEHIPLDVARTYVYEPLHHNETIG